MNRKTIGTNSIITIVLILKGFHLFEGQLIAVQPEAGNSNLSEHLWYVKLNSPGSGSLW